MPSSRTASSASSASSASLASSTTLSSLSSSDGNDRSNDVPTLAQSVAQAVVHIDTHDINVNVNALAHVVKGLGDDLQRSSRSLQHTLTLHDQPRAATLHEAAILHDQLQAGVNNAAAHALRHQQTPLPLPLPQRIQTLDTCLSNLGDRLDATEAASRRRTTSIYGAIDRVEARQVEERNRVEATQDDHNSRLRKHSDDLSNLNNGLAESSERHDAARETLSTLTLRQRRDGDGAARIANALDASLRPSRNPTRPLSPRADAGMQRLRSLTRQLSGVVQAGSLEQGVPGPQGEHGERGERGEIGPRGLVGATGMQGERGARGERGDVGLRGSDGARGVEGSRGERGLQGQQGLQGKRGERGLQGERGERGLQGERGPPVDLNPYVHRTAALERRVDNLRDGLLPILNNAHVRFLNLERRVDGHETRFTNDHETLDQAHSQRLEHERRTNLRLDNLKAKFDDLRRHAGNDDGMAHFPERRVDELETRLRYDEQTHRTRDTRLANLELRSDGHDTRLRNGEQTRQTHDTRLASLEQRAEGHDTRFTNGHEALDSEKRFTQLDERLNQLGNSLQPQLTNLQREVNRTARTVADVEALVNHSLQSTTSPQPTSLQPTSSQPISSPPTSSLPTSPLPTSLQPTSSQPTSLQPTSLQPTSSHSTMPSQPTQHRWFPIFSFLSDYLSEARAPYPTPRSSTPIMSIPQPDPSSNTKRGRSDSDQMNEARQPRRLKVRWEGVNEGAGIVPSIEVNHVNEGNEAIDVDREMSGAGGFDTFHGEEEEEEEEDRHEEDSAHHQRLLAEARRGKARQTSPPPPPSPSPSWCLTQSPTMDYHPMDTIFLPGGIRVRNSYAPTVA